jgi:hypothetical protein
MIGAVTFYTASLKSGSVTQTGQVTGAFEVRPKMSLCRNRAQRRCQQRAGWRALQYSAVLSVLRPTDRSLMVGGRVKGLGTHNRAKSYFCLIITAGIPNDDAREHVTLRQRSRPEGPGRQRQSMAARLRGPCPGRAGERDPGTATWPGPGAAKTDPQSDE